ncbi:hypothetical protein [Mucilaginibacter jinjuensis]|uniref:Zinc finger protein n=1 Tax=Mucilaginibacter jinjuensis TaxID=1176721 RepID=A0ABY7T4F9_9SPHI|nr:hypothetical protein [Mucilaginibacter jinjuensis]WCT10587.1 hypothetical protein PQO05_17770 [Mucilaginibacter jinjuensis]
MSELKKIAYNCRKATFLIEKKQIDSLTLREKLELKIHLAGCSVCRTFQQQSIVINKMVHDLLHSTQNREITLDKEFKDELQNRIEEELNKK